MRGEYRRKEEKRKEKKRREQSTKASKQASKQAGSRSREPSGKKKEPGTGFRRTITPKDLSRSFTSSRISQGTCKRNSYGFRRLETTTTTAARTIITTTTTTTQTFLFEMHSDYFKLRIRPRNVDYH
ncbi:hypothetical protein V1478_013184 [Vespula squamosa]|uniref:Uncharacterized protein n=1 Tax=Vespula squamosa TaxID=30214 RepID=A0ABD2AA35_VESSQ